MDRLRALEAYVRVVDLGSFSAAAKDLRTRQGTISRWVAALEDELGVQLLDRTTRGIRSTEAGAAFYTEARTLLGAWDQAVSSARREQRDARGRLRVSVPVVFGARFVTPLFAPFLAAHPKVELDVQFADRYVDLVAEGVDVAIRVGRRVDAEYRARTLAETPRRLVASPAYLDERGTPRAPEDLREHVCLLHSGLDNRVTWVFGSQRVDVRGRFAANHSEALASLAIAGHGVALLASWLVDDAIRSGALVQLLESTPAANAPVQALFSSTRHPSRAVRAFVDALASALPGRLSAAERPLPPAAS